ncbi:MAG: glycine--tRNA ligase subunit beta [Fimbriimonas sp.]|nr:glycine--tRNA ligase subunit beta [Fimbriimonas sp.]
MPELLLELGCEELPASFVRKASSDLLQNITSLLSEAGLIQGAGTALGTPRRLIVAFAEIRERQDDATKEVRGPGIKGAYDSEGKPTQALLGFCRGQGVSADDLHRDDQYVWVTKTVVGRSAEEILNEVLPKAIRAMTFDKTMRWGGSRMRFARPIRWILACFAGKSLDFEIEGVRSGTKSRGHRFYAPEPFEATTLDELVQSLRMRKVEPDPAVRRALVETQAKDVADGAPELTEALIEENVYLTEWPTAIQGEFRQEYLELPEAVLVTAMAKHEKMFPVRNEHGKLTNRFVFVRNSGEDDSVRAGAQWVLNARFNDAKFFFDEDSKHDLAYFLEKTDGIVFQEKLGSVRKRADRLSRLSEQIAAQTGAKGREIEFAREAGLYAKADLSTGLVSELSSLQGVIGGAYARRQGIFGSIAWAIETQYDISKNTDPGFCSGERASLRLAMADQLDKLAGYLGIGQEPSGSSDPYGLRRAATILIEAAWMWPESLPNYEEFFRFALSLYAEQGVPLDENAASKAIRTVFASRYTAMLPNVRHDLLEASLIAPESATVTAPRGVRLRAQCLEALAVDTGFVQTATRPLNIVASARKKGIDFAEGAVLDQVDPSGIESPEGVALLNALQLTAGALNVSAQSEDSSGIVEQLRTLADPINRFFETTMVMAEDPAVRYARLSLMQAVSEQLLVAGDFSKIVIEG